VSRRRRRKRRAQQQSKKGVKGFFSRSGYRGSWGSLLYGDEDDGSFSSAWMGGRSYGYGYGYSYHQTEEQKKAAELQSILDSIANTASIACRKDSERDLSISWQGTQGAVEEDIAKNARDENVIYIDPDIISEDHSLKPGWSKNRKVDVLVADVLRKSSMMSTNYEDAKERIEELINGVKKDIASNVWKAIEVVEAEREVLKRYRGFGGYFKTSRSYFGDSKDSAPKLQKFSKLFSEVHSQTGESPLAAITGSIIAFKILNPTAAVTLPREVAEEVIQGIQDVAALEGTNSLERFECAMKIARRLVSKWKPNSEEASPMSNSAMPIGLPQDGDTQSEVPKSIPKDVLDELKRATTGKDFNPLDMESQLTKGIKTKTVTVKSDGRLEADYKALATEAMPVTRSIRNSVQIVNEKAGINEHGLTRGRIDEGSLHKILLNEFTDNLDKSVFEEEMILSERSVSFSILVDESGSMAGEKVLRARLIAIGIAEALKNLPGVGLSVSGHRANGWGWNPNRAGRSDYDMENHAGCIVHDYLSPENPHHRAMVKIDAGGSNLDGHAIIEVGRNVAKWFPLARRKYIILICDGQPCSAGYSGLSAVDHTGKCVEAVRKSGVDVICIGINNAFGRKEGDIMYSPGKYVILKDDNYAGLIGNFISKQVRKAWAMDEHLV